MAWCGPSLAAHRARHAEEEQPAAPPHAGRAARRRRVQRKRHKPAATTPLTIAESLLRLRLDSDDVFSIDEEYEALDALAGRHEYEAPMLCSLTPLKTSSTSASPPCSSTLCSPAPASCSSPGSSAFAASDASTCASCPLTPCPTRAKEAPIFAPESVCKAQCDDIILHELPKVASETRQLQRSENLELESATARGRRDAAGLSKAIATIAVAKWPSKRRAMPRPKELEAGPPPTRAGQKEDEDLTHV